MIVENSNEPSVVKLRNQIKVKKALQNMFKSKLVKKKPPPPPEPEIEEVKI